MQIAERSSALCRGSVVVHMLNVLGCLEVFGLVNCLKCTNRIFLLFPPQKATNYSMQHLQTGWTFQK